MLVQGERSVEALATEAQLSAANASQHLQVLARARLIESRRDGQRVLYRIADLSVEALWQTVRHTAERRLAELESVTLDYLRDRDGFEPIDRTELIRRMDEGTVTLLDVRPTEEFAQGHLPGAISVPLGQLATWVKASAEPPATRKQIVAYCRGPYCVWALQAVALLTEQGIRAVRLREGVGEWRAAGLPLETEYISQL